MKKLLEASQKARQDAARILTAQVRQHALEHGWDSEVVNNLSVIHKDGKFQTHVHPDYADRAFVHEYGTDSVRPTAALRKFITNEVHSSNAFMVALENRWRKVQ